MRIKRGICGDEGRNERGCVGITGEIGGDYGRLRRGLRSKRGGLQERRTGD